MEGDDENLFLVPADFMSPPRGAEVMCACGVMEVCRCDGIGQESQDFTQGDY